MSSKLNPDFFGKIDCKNLGSFLENEPYTAQVTNVYGNYGELKNLLSIFQWFFIMGV